ncbi:heme exporter protein CcmD [Pseudooceanicola aestuarii]|uniref:heme exporter protein CcmD n=1 Tax=Pseudooceanicola aestuarii TaxID=2697319 RepID=UPI003B82D1C9
MPELGKYAAEVLSAYGLSLLLLAGVTGISLWRARRVRARLDEVEKQVKHG